MEEANGDKAEEDQKQRKIDMDDLAKTYENSYPKNSIGNYSKNQVRLMQGGEKKVRFIPMNKGNSKPIPLEHDDSGQQ